MNVYDFDKTVYDGDSSLDFFLYVLSKKPHLAALAPFQAWGVVKYLFGAVPREGLKEAFFIFLRFIPAQEMARRFWDKNQKKMKGWYLRQKRESDVIVSASPDFLLRPFVCGRLGVNLIASNVDPATGKFLGKNCRGEEKTARFYGEYPGASIENFYSDSSADAPLAAKAMQSFAVKGRKIAAWNDLETGLFAKIKGAYFTRDFAMFVFCGGMGTLANFLISLIVSTALDPSVSYVFGYGISLFVAYSLNAKLIFRKKISAADFVKFVVSYIPNFLILFTFVAVFLNLLGWNKVAVYASAGLLGLPVTFLLVKIMVMKK